jgi:hypothetical protein
MSQYIKVTIPELGACAVSIYTCPPDVTADNLASFVRTAQRQATKKRLNATYEASTREEYVAYRSAQKAAIDAADAARKAAVQS